MQDQKNWPSGYHRTTLPGYIFATKACIDNRKNNLLSSNIFPTCPHNMVNFGPLAAEIVSLVWGTLANFKAFASRQRYCTLHGSQVMSISQTLRHWTEGTTYVRFGRTTTLGIGFGPHSSSIYICAVSVWIVIDGMLHFALKMYGVLYLLLSHWAHFTVLRFIFVPYCVLLCVVCSSLDRVLSHWAHFTVLRFIFVLCITVCCMHA